MQPALDQAGHVFAYQKSADDLANKKGETEKQNALLLE
jgi:hypothetical protein